MGYSHGKKWTDELIEETIFEVMEALDIKRMPSNKECIAVTKSYALSNKISKTLGFYGWAEKIGIEIKNSETKEGLKYEKKVTDMIKDETGLKSYITGSKGSYDILVDEKVKIEVKFSNGYGDKYYTCNLYNGRHQSDVLVFVCRNKEIGNKNLVIPSHHITDLKQLSIGKKSRYDKYIDRWDYITKFNEFLKKL